MAGLYIHIPFCRHKCAYCNFFSVASRRMQQGFTVRLAEEAGIQSGYWKNETFDTLYFGGGTPSWLPSGEIALLMEVFRDRFHLDGEAEITLEANPDDIEMEALEVWLKAGINRLSIGIQATDGVTLAGVGRQHSAASDLESVAVARKAGFGNLSLDLIYGIPGLDAETWRRTLETVLGLRPEHLSAYALTLEEGTVYAWQVRKKAGTAPVDETAAYHYGILQELTADAGYLQYEVSNFCLPGCESRHNTSYWKGIPYLGLGPSAHSYNGSARWWNPASLKGYAEVCAAPPTRREGEILGLTERYNEYVLTRLRTSRGIVLQEFEKSLGMGCRDYLLKQSEKPAYRGLVLENDRMYISPRHYLWADGIIAGLLMSGE